MKRSRRTLTKDEIYIISNLWKQGAGFSDIGRVLEVASSTVFTASCEGGVLFN